MNRIIEKYREGAGSKIEGKGQPEGTTPRSILDDAKGNYRPEHRGRERRRLKNTHGQEPRPSGHHLGDARQRQLLYRIAHADKGTANDDSPDLLCSRSHHAPNGANYVAHYEEIAAAIEIT